MLNKYKLFDIDFKNNFKTDLLMELNDDPVYIMLLLLLVDIVDGDFNTGCERFEVEMWLVEG